MHARTHASGVLPALTSEGEPPEERALKMKAALGEAALLSHPLPTLPAFTRKAHSAKTVAAGVSQITRSKGKTQNVGWIS